MVPCMALNLSIGCVPSTHPSHAPKSTNFPWAISYQWTPGVRWSRGWHTVLSPSWVIALTYSRKPYDCVWSLCTVHGHQQSVYANECTLCSIPGRLSMTISIWLKCWFSKRECFSFFLCFLYTRNGMSVIDKRPIMKWWLWRLAC